MRVRPVTDGPRDTLLRQIDRALVNRRRDRIERLVENATAWERVGADEVPA